MPISDHRDWVIEELAEEEARLREQVVRLGEQLATYRLIAVEAIHQLHDVHADLASLRAQHHRLLDAHRQLRSQMTAGPTRIAA